MSSSSGRVASGAHAASCEPPVASPSRVREAVVERRLHAARLRRGDANPPSLCLHAAGRGDDVVAGRTGRLRQLQAEHRDELIVHRLEETTDANHVGASNSCSNSTSSDRARSTRSSSPGSAANVRSGGSHGPIAPGDRNSSAPGATMRCVSTAVTLRRVRRLEREPDARAQQSAIAEGSRNARTGRRTRTTRQVTASSDRTRTARRRCGCRR